MLIMGIWMFVQIDGVNQNSNYWDIMENVYILQDFKVKGMGNVKIIFVGEVFMIVGVYVL